MDNINEYIKTSDDALFHYTKVSTAIEHILHAKKFRLSILGDTNDPNEYKRKLFDSHRRASAEETQVEEKQYDELLRKAEDRIERIRRFECRVMCFCTNDKPTLILSDGSSRNEELVSEGWAKSRMWSQYGENHRGICLVFSKRELELVLALAKKESQIKFYKAESVKYSEQGLRCPQIDGTRLNKEGDEKYSVSYIEENYNELFFRKHVDYRDEAEFRVLVLDADKKLEYLDITSFIKCAIIGDRTHEAYIPLIYQMSKDLNIECRKAGWSRSRGCMYIGNYRTPNLSRQFRVPESPQTTGSLRVLSE